MTEDNAQTEDEVRAQFPKTAAAVDRLQEKLARTKAEDDAQTAGLKGEATYTVE